jgi:RNA polymerase sigma-70 factor (ECF subfamily)
MRPISEQELLRRARAGDQGAFRTLVEEYEPVVAATVNSMLGSGDEADDVGQETFIRFYRALDEYREEATIKTYLTRIAINLSLNALKRRRRFFARHVEADPAPMMPDTEPGPAEQLERLELRAQVRRAIDELAPKHRAVVTLRLIDGYSTRETAQILGVPEGTVLSRLSRALKGLKPHLQTIRDGR